MPSRKKNKGKERKAKKVENERLEIRKLWTTRTLTSGSSSFQCNHGIGLSDAIPDAVSNFMDRYIINIERTNLATQENLIDTFENHSQVWNNDNFRRVAINVFTDGNKYVAKQARK